MKRIKVKLVANNYVKFVYYGKDYYKELKYNGSHGLYVEITTGFNNLMRYLKRWRTLSYFNK